MNDPLRTAEQELPPLPQQTLVEFLEAFHRIFKIGTYYPEGHSVLDKAAHLFQHNLQKITEAKRSAGVELKGAAILVEGQEITAITRPISEVIRLFRDLGIGRIEIDRAVTLSDLLQFARTLLLYRAQLLGVKQFTKAKIENLPSTIRIVQHEFLIDESSILGDNPDDGQGQSLEAVFHMLEEQGLDRQQVAQCREFINTLAQRFAKHPIKLKGMPAISWHDVRKLLTTLVTSAFQFGEGSARVFRHNDLNALSAIFNGLRQELDDDDASRDTINLLVRAFHRGHIVDKSQPETESNKTKSLRSKDRGTDMTIGDIQAFVHDNHAESELLARIQQGNPGDELAVLLQLLRFTQDDEVGEDIRRGLRGILAGALSPLMVDILIKGVVHLAESAESRRLRKAVQFITLQLRGRATYSSLPFLIILCGKLQPAIIEILWPTMVNELLAVGRQADQQQLFNELARIAARIPLKAMREQAQELDGLEAIKERKIASDIFDVELKHAYPIYAVLLETSLRMPIASRVLASLRAAPRDWLIEAVAPLLDLTQPQHMQFLHAYLTVAEQQRYPVRLCVMAGKLVVERLPLIDDEARKEPWAAKTISAMAEIQVEGTRELLEGILAEKKLIVVPKWPSPCRQAATQSLKLLKRKPLG